MQVMMRLFSPRKTTLLFVIRDKTRVCLSFVLFPLLKYLLQCFMQAIGNIFFDPFTCLNLKHIILFM
jgi:hypothetical protein